MTNPFAARLIFAVALFPALLARPLCAADNTAVQSLASDNAAFACDLYSQLKTADGNLFFSPYSISTCLAMTYAGARAETAKAMAKTLHFNADPVAMAAPFAALQQQFNSAATKTGVQFNIANALWAQDGHPFQPAFLKLATQQYRARLEQVDFLTNAEPARNDINDWVSAQTKGKILNLIPERALNAQTRLVLVNAIYFKGAWTAPFHTNQTSETPFNLTRERKVTAPLMHQTGNFNYAETADLQLLELPYGGAANGSASNTTRFSLVVVLPKNPDNLSSLEVALTPAALGTWLAAAQIKEVSVFLPRFKMMNQFNLGDTLSTMGMTEAFSPHADFSGMDGNFDLQISAVVHKAFVEVNEQGTEAAAATAVTVKAMAMEPHKNPVFRADHPFLFFIREANSGSILFLGRLNDPTK